MYNAVMYAMIKQEPWRLPSRQAEFNSFFNQGGPQRLFFDNFKQNNIETSNLE